jgi:ribosomal-protein-alanine N-acetyltransferase
MSEVIIQAERLRLVLQTPEEVLARIEALSPADKAEVSPVWLARVRASTVADPWTHGFCIVDRAGGAVIGNCGYKGPPDAQGVVEIAYGVNPDHQGRGYATEAASALVDFAFGNDGVRLIRAHTLPGNRASAQVLIKCGFEQVGEVVDAEDGLVCRWERARAAA